MKRFEKLKPEKLSEKTLNANKYPTNIDIRALSICQKPLTTRDFDLRHSNTVNYQAFNNSPSVQIPIAAATPYQPLAIVTAPD